MALRQFSSSFAQGEFQFLIVFPVVIRTFVPVSGMRTGARPPNRECKQFVYWVHFDTLNFIVGTQLLLWKMYCFSLL